MFDASKAEAAANADWVVDAGSRNLGYSSGPAVLNGGNESNAQRTPSPAQSGISASTSETYWDGALSYWGIDCVNRNYIVESLPYNGQITYGNSSNLQDLSNYDVFIVCEPNILFTAAQKTAIITFVQNGGGLLMVADHTISDRNNDGDDSPFIWNDLMSNNSVQVNPFGMTFDLVDFSQTTSNLPNLPTDSILHGPAGNVTQVQFSGGTSITLSPVQNSSVKGVVYKTGSSFGNSNVMVAYARYGNGKVAAIGDSSPCDDGTGDPNDGLFFGYTQDAGGNHRKLLMNMTIWLATQNTVAPPVADFVASPLTVCLGQTTTFTDNSTSGITSYSWNFGSGASPATASTVGPHIITYSTSGLKTISLTVTNPSGTNSITKTNYVNIDGNCSTTDIGVISLISPATSICPTSDSQLKIQIKNFGTTSINFSSSPVTINIQATDPASSVLPFSQTINTGTILAGATLDVIFSGTYNMLESGTYIFNSNATIAGDVNSTNDAMLPASIVVNPGFESDIILIDESIGTVSSTTAIATHETNNGFDNDNLTMSGTGDIRITSFSTGYPSASGGANVFFTASGRNFIISGINTSTSSNMELSFGVLKSVATSNGSDLSVQVSVDGTNYTNLIMPSLPLNTNWNYATVSGSIPSVPNLRIKFTTTSATQYRIDDLLLIEKVTQPTISVSGNLEFCQGGNVLLTAPNATSYLWSDNSTSQNLTVTSGGNYFVTVSNSFGCTSSSSPVNVIVDPVYSVTQIRYIAQGTSYILPNSQTVSTSGIYPVTLQSVNSCDSVITTDLRVVLVDDNNLCTTDACDLFTGTVSHTAVNTDDGNPCTIDGCNPLTGVFHTLIAEICGNGIDDNCNGQTDENCLVTLSLRVLIEGFYQSNGKMIAAIDSVNLPLICDTITVELHSSVNPYSMLYSDKKTIDRNGNGVFSFPSGLLGQSLYIVVKHRNSLQTWSAAPVLFNSNAISFTFSDLINKAFGSNQKNLGNGFFAMISGDVNQNGVVDSSDFSIIENNMQQFLTGYLPSDVTGNKITESSDGSVVENNYGKTILKP